MNSLLDKFLLTMRAENRAALLKIMKQEDYAIDGDDKATLERKLRELSGKIEESSSFNFRPSFQVGRMKSKSYNQNMEQIEQDLRIIYFISSMVDQYMSSYFRFTNSEMQEIRKSVSDMKKRLNHFKLLSGKNVPFSSYSYESFEHETKTETDLTLLEVLAKGKSGEEFNRENIAEVRGGELVLAGVEVSDQLKTGYGRALADIHVSRRNGYVEEVPGHDIRKAFDTSSETYWAENLLVDEPIDSSRNLEWSRSLNHSDLQGAVVELEISLHSVSSVSELHYHPFGFYPLEILSITGYQNTDFGGEEYILIHPEHEEPSQRNRKSIDNMIFRFPAVDIGSLRVLIRQETHTKSDYVINKDDENSYELWMTMSSNQIPSPDFKQKDESFSEFNQKLDHSGWMKYLTELKKWARDENQSHIIESADKAIEIVRTGDFNSSQLLALRSMDPRVEIPDKLNNQFVAISKTSYIYGAKNIQLIGRRYKESSTYLSKSLDLSINIKKLTLETKEEHQYLKNKRTGEKVKVTDIEYYITGKKNPQIDEWHPILPIGSTVEGERLTGDNIGGKDDSLGGGNITYSLRFQAVSVGSIVIYRDGIAIPKSQYLVSSDFRRVAILKAYFVPTSIYTISYQPTVDAYEYDISKDSRYAPSQYVDENGQNGETFRNVKAGEQLMLKNTPLISRGSILKKEDREYGYYQNDDYINQDEIDYPMNVWVDGIKLMNVSKYDSSTFNPEDLLQNDGYTFAQRGRKLVLGIPKDKKEFNEVRVDYRYVVTDVRLKAILRRNTLDTESLTPSLLEYSVRAETNDLESKEGGVYS